MSLLQVKDLSVYYGERVVVDAVSFSIDQGESLGLVGESGSGKSQTALALLGLLPRNARMSGTIRFAGAEIANCGDRVLDQIRGCRIGMVFQDPMQALNPYITIGKQLRQILSQHGLASGDAAYEASVHMLNRVGLPDPDRQLHAYAHQLSGGMRQRAMIAMALIAGPDLLVADEPTTALDVTVQAQVLDLLEDVRNDTALLLITHDLGVVANRCERLLVFEHGRLVESGATAVVFAAPKSTHMQRLLSTAPRVDRGDIQRAARTDSVLVVEDATVAYRDARNTQYDVVQNTSLSLYVAETLAIVGESGSGKTSLVRAILGLAPLRSGRITYLGEPLPGPVEARTASLRRDLQLLFQDPASALNPQMRVSALVSEPLQIHEPHCDREGRDQRVIATLATVGLDSGVLRKYPHELSGGQAQRVAIARAMILQPRVLVCDEAVAALDSLIRTQVLDVLRSAQKASDLSIIFISHDLAVVRTFCHRVAVMYAGRLVEVAASSDLFSAPRHPYSRAILDASPIPEPLHSMQTATLQGESPSLITPPAGCAFHPRCEFAVAVCRATRPALQSIGSSVVACHRAADITLG